MKKIIITITIALLWSLTAMAEIRRVAVFDPAGNAPSHVNEIVREIASSVIVNTPGFTVLERSLIDQVLRENRFQAEGLVDDAQISEMGRMMGANLTFVINLTRMSDGNFFISARLIDVQTARIEKQQTTRTTRAGETELINTSERLAQEMFAQVAPPPPTRAQQQARPTVQATPPPPTIITANMLTVDRRRVSQGGRQLSQAEVRQVMSNANNFNALAMYDRGIRRNRTGDILLWSGVGLTAVGATLAIAFPAYQDEITGRWESPILGEVGLAGVGIGSTMAIVGLILKSTSRRPIQDAVNTHNRSLNRADATNIELNLGTTPNGFGLTLNF